MGSSSPPPSKFLPWFVLLALLPFLATCDCARLRHDIRDVHSTDYHLISDHRKVEMGSLPQGQTFNFFPRGVPLPPSGPSKRRNTELGPSLPAQIPDVIRAVRSTNHHRKLETVSPNFFPRRAPLPPSGHSKRRNTELSPSDRAQLIGAVRSTDHHRIISDRRNLEMGFRQQGQMFNFLPRGVPLPPSAPSKRRNTELQSDPLP